MRSGRGERRERAIKHLAPPARRRVFLPGRKYFFKSALETVLLAAILWYTDMVEDDGFRHISCGGPARLQMRKTGCLRSQNHNTAHRRRLPSGACSPRAAHPIVQVKWTRATGSRRILFSPAFFIRAASFADAAIEAAVCVRIYTNSKNAPRTASAVRAMFAAAMTGMRIIGSSSFVLQR